MLPNDSVLIRQNFIVAFAFFLDIFFDYPIYWYNFLMYFIPYMQVCAGISYLSNLTLIILIDMGKRKLLYSDSKLRTMRRIVHIIVSLLTFTILAEFLITYILTKEK